MDQASPALDLVDLVERHYGLLYRYAYRLSGSQAEAEDLTQQTYLIAQQKLLQLKNRGRAKSWLCAILRNVYLEAARKSLPSRFVPLESIAEPAQPKDIADPDPEQVQLVLSEMPEEFRTPVILFYFEEFSYKDIAAQMEIPLGTVMSRLARGKAYLRRRLPMPEPASAGS